MTISIGRDPDLLLMIIVSGLYMNYNIIQLLCLPSPSFDEDDLVK